MNKLLVLTLIVTVLSVPTVLAIGPAWEETPLRIEVLTDKEYYHFGENVQITVKATNTTERDLTLTFPSSYQADYSIDARYLWSWNKGFWQAFTGVEIPAGESHSWEFVHTSADYALAPGEHSITGMVVGYGHSQPLTIVVGPRNGLKVTASTDKETYSIGEEIPIQVTITNESEADVELHFRSGREAGYCMDYRYVRWNGSDELDVARSVTLAPGESETWDFVHDPNEYSPAPGTHTLKGMVVGYGESELIEFLLESSLEITVDTDKDEYALDEDVQISITATNTSAEDITLHFPTSHQASYVIDGRYDWARNHPALGVLTDLTIPAGESHTWSFTHTPEDYRLLPGTHSIVGVVIGYGKSEPKKIVVAADEVPIEVSVSTDKEAYEFGEPVAITVTAKNTSEEPVRLRFPTLHQADYQLDEEYLWSRGKQFLPIPISFTIPGGAEVNWHFVHRPRQYELAPGEHSVVGIVVGYGRSEPLTFVVEEEEPPGDIIVRGLLTRLEEPLPLSSGGDEFLLYSPETDETYYLFPDGVDLAPHVNMTVEVKAYPVDTYLPVPGIPLGVTSIRDLLRVDVETDKVEYYQQENIEISVIARNLTDEPFTLTIDPLSEVYAFVDDIYIVQVVYIIPPTPIPITIPGGGSKTWTLTFVPRREPLSLGEHWVRGGIWRYGKSDAIPIRVIEKPSDKIVAEGIVDVLSDDAVLYNVGDAPRYVLVDRLTGDKLYILRNPSINFGNYLGQFVEVVGVTAEAVNNGDTTLQADQASPELFVLRIRRILAIAVSTDKAAYSPGETIAVYVTAKNCTTEELVLTFDSAEQAYYSISSDEGPLSPMRSLGESDPTEVVLAPYGLHVWEFAYIRDAVLPVGDYTVLGGIYGYGQAQPVSISVADDPPPVVTATGIIEAVWWRYWNWFCPCWYVLLDPEQKQVTYFLTSDRVELSWYLGRYVRVTGHVLDLVCIDPTLGGANGYGSGDGGWERPVPPILPPWDITPHLNVVSVVPLADGPPPDDNGNGLPDGWEIATGLDAIGAGKDDDSDGDGASNFRELLCGTDPLDPESVVEVRVQFDVTGMVRLRWRTVLGRTYSVYCADGLSQGALRWRRLVGGIEGTGDECIWTDDGATDIAPSNASGVNSRFYRVEIE